MMGRDLGRLLPVALGTSVVPMDSAVNVAFPAIVDAFALPLPAIQWVVVCYVLTYGSLMLAVGRIGDIFGHRRVFRLGLIWSAVALLLCALAPGPGALLACRVLQGIGAALVIGCGPALATSLFPEAQRLRALAAYAAAFAAGTAMGPLVGGVLVQGFGWPAVFWVRVPVALLALWLLRGVPSTARAAIREPFDAAGALLLATCIAATLLAINRAPSALGLGLGLAAVALLALLGSVWRSRRAPRPILDLRLFRRPGFAALNLASVLVQFAGFAVMLLAPFHLARILGLPPILAGLLLAVGPAGMMLGAALAGRIGRPRAAMLAGLALGGLGLLLIAQWGARPTLMGLIVPLALQGIGIGLFTVTYTDAITAAMRREDRGVAGSLTMLTRTLGVVAAASLLSLLFAAAEARNLATGAAPEQAFLDAFGRVFLLAGALPLAALLLLALRTR